MQNIKSKKGFTIIEVVLVLAIAGLIFLMVFIALPAMQRSQRDTQRRNDYSQLSAAMTSYMTNNNGALPTSLNSTAGANGDPAKYINEKGQDPNGFTYQLGVLQCKTGTVDNDGYCQLVSGSWPAAIKKNIAADTATTVRLVRNAGCNDGKPVYKASSRAFVIFGNLESGNGTYCSASS